MMKFGVLGPLSVTRDGKQVDVSRPLERRLLAVLLTNRSRVPHDDQIIHALWPAGLPGYPGQALRTSVSRLRKMLGAPELIVRDGGGYRLLLEPGSVDADRFEALLLSADPGNRVARLREALDLWTSDEPYADLRYEDFVQAEAQRLRALRLQAHEDLFAERLAAGESHELIPDLELMLGQDPHRESLYGVLMLAQYRAGQQPAALRTFQTAKSVLAEDLGLEPSKPLVDLEERILLEDPQLILETPIVPNNIPSRIAAIFGRDTDVEALTAHLGDRRLVTITGPLGVGKSAAAIESAGRVVATGQMESWYIDLSEVDADDEVPVTVTDRLATLLQRPTDRDWVTFTPGRLIGTKKMLIVLDNCEHVVDGASTVTATILEECPNSKILTTSRERLGLPGELVYSLEPLIAGAEGEAVLAPQDAIDRYPALRVFTDRAQAAAPGFRLSPADVPPALQLCRKLDGLPLALELAAARVGSLAISEIERGIDGYFRILGQQRGVDTRHRSLETAIAWSYDLLEDTQQEYLQILARVSGPFTVADATTLLPIDAEPLVAAVVTSLRDRSLLRYQGAIGNEGQFLMLRTVRDFALARADEAGRSREHKMRHARCFGLLAAEAGRHLTGGPLQLHWFNRCEASTTDLLQAIETFVDEDHVEEAVDIVAAAGAVWTRFRHQAAAYPTIRDALAASGDTIFDSTPRAHVVASWIRTDSPEQQFRDGSAHAEDALRASRVVGDDASAAIAMGLLGLNAWIAGQFGEARELVTGSCSLVAGEEGTWAETFVLIIAGLVEHALEPSAAGSACLERAAELSDLRSDEASAAWANGFLGSALTDAGHYSRAQAAYDRAYLSGRRIGDPEPAILGAAGLALVSWLKGDARAAADAADRALNLLEPLTAAARYDALSLPFPGPSRTSDIAATSEAMNVIYEEPHAERSTAFIRYLLETAEERAIHYLDPARVAEIQAALEVLDGQVPSERSVTRR